jgi:DNA-binding CsgD family transcriptional regulator
VEPERALVESALWHLARDVRRLVFPRRAEAGPAVAPMQREVRTGLGRYTLRASVVPPGAVGPHEAALVTVEAAVAPRAPSPSEVRDRLGLTAREAEVALLLADGLTNAAIAERLFVAPATAKRHVEAVLGKLGVPGRAAVARRLAVG